MEASLAPSRPKWRASRIEKSRCEHTKDFQNSSRHTDAHDANNHIK